MKFESKQTDKESFNCSASSNAKYHLQFRNSNTYSVTGRSVNEEVHAINSVTRFGEISPLW